MYCGNNRLSRKLANGAQIGDRLGCLRRGIYIGLNLPYDEEYTGQYEPIDNTRLYCGTRLNLPENYDRIGQNHECHRIGVGIGKRIKASKSTRKNRQKRRSRRSKRSRKSNRKHKNKY